MTPVTAVPASHEVLRQEQLNQIINVLEATGFDSDVIMPQLAGRSLIELKAIYAQLGDAIQCVLVSYAPVLCVPSHPECKLPPCEEFTLVGPPIH